MDFFLFIIFSGIKIFVGDNRVMITQVNVKISQKYIHNCQLLFNTVFQIIIKTIQRKNNTGLFIFI
ncbi:MAG: hypothetical protein WCG25_06780 [bacterium]